MSWSDERAERLRVLWAEGRSASVIARDLGDVTRNAVIGKAHRMNLPLQGQMVVRKRSPAPRALKPTQPLPPRPVAALPPAPAAAAALPPAWQPPVTGLPFPREDHPKRPWRQQCAWLLNWSPGAARCCGRGVGKVERSQAFGDGLDSYCDAHRMVASSSRKASELEEPA